jgi:hypothetical protein
MKQGGAERVVESGGYDTYESGGYRSMEAGAYDKYGFQTLSTGSTSGISAYGVTALRSTGAAKTFTMDTPVSGVIKHIVVTASASTTRIKASASSTAGFGDGNTILKSTHSNIGFTAIGTTDGKWAILGKSTLFGTTST